jgi:hypothetical protein
MLKQIHQKLIQIFSRAGEDDLDYDCADQEVWSEPRPVCGFNLLFGADKFHTPF